MRKKLPSETVHELNCLRNTVKQLKSANEYHKGKIAIYETERAKSRLETPWFLVALLSGALVWSLLL